MGSPPKTPTQRQQQQQQRRPLHERSHSATNTGIRVVPYSPPRLSSAHSASGPSDVDDGDNDDNDDDGGNNDGFTSSSYSSSIYARTPLPTHPAHILAPPARSPGQGPALGGLPTQSEAPWAVSSLVLPRKPQAAPGFAPLPAHQHPQSGQPTAAGLAGPALKPKPLPKRRKHVALNPDNKTFRVLDLDQHLDDHTADDVPTSPRSPPRSLTSPSSTSYSSHHRPSSDTAQGFDASLTSSSSGRPESTAASSPSASIGPTCPPPLADHLITSSPWDYRLVGGLRKVPKTPDLKQKAASASPDWLPPLPETSDDSKEVRQLSTKASFQSTATIDSVISSDNNSNYKVYGSSPTPAYPLIPPPSSRDSDLPLLDQPSTSPPESHFEDSLDTHSETASLPNYQVLGASSPAPASQHSGNSLEQSPVITQSDSGENTNYRILGFSSPVSSELDLSTGNYQVYGDPSPSTSQVALSSSQTRVNYSRESLVVPPLRPRSKRSTEKFGYYKQRSRESLRTGSFTSITSVLSQEALRTLLTSGSAVNLPVPSYAAGSSSWANPLALHPARIPMQAHPHQWSSQLSTVPSESDGGTDRGSRSFSDGRSLSFSENTTRRSVGFASPHSRQMPSISSSLQQQDDNQSYIEELDYPQPAFGRGQRDTTGSTIRVVEDQDEYGDGLTDMPDLRSRSSRNRLSDFYSLTSDNGRTNTMRSTSSSRANSLLANSIPTWARLYYGSGERRYLGLNVSSSEISSPSRASSFRSGSPDTSNFPSNLYSPRRRPRQLNPNTGRPETRDSMAISPLPHLGSDGLLIHGNYRSRFRSSSIWSPHLGIDRRANSKRMTVWDGAPSINFSTESGMFGKRNRQLVMFIAGFVFPIAWMIASFLPLPSQPMFVMRERNSRQSNLDMNEEMARQFRPMDEARYESARWWRTLNRGMSVVGIAVIAAIVTLVILGIMQNWTK